MMARVLAWWRRIRRHDYWWEHTTGDYIDLRPRIDRREWL